MAPPGDTWRRVAAGDDVGQELASMLGPSEARGVTDVVVDLDQWRRARRLLPILVDRHGLAWFLDGDTFPAPARLDDDRVERCVQVAATWIERRSGRAVDAHGLQTMRTLLIQHLRELVHAGVTVSRR